MRRNRIYATLITCLLVFRIYAQIGPYDRGIQMPTRDLYDTDMMGAAINAARQMSQRVIQIKQAVQPFREQQYQYYKAGKYKEAIDVCNKVVNQFIYYANDHKAIKDMETLAGDCSLQLRDFESAIDWYQKARNAGDEYTSSKLLQVFNLKMNDARESNKKGNYYALWKDVTVAMSTGWENGECYYYYGACAEKSGDLKEAKKMYKIAKKKSYSPAIMALRELKKKK